MNLKRLILVSSIFVFGLLILGKSLKGQNTVYDQDYIEIQSAENGFKINIYYDGTKQVLYPWYDDTTEVWEVFLPSYLNSGEDIKCHIEQKKLQISNVESKEEILTLKNKEIYELSKEKEKYSFRFNLSKNIPTLFIETESGTMHNLNKSKDNEERGKIFSVNKDEEIEFFGDIERISGRGNGTWTKEKKPFDIKLLNKGRLAGLDAAKEWVLLALHYEGDKIHSKIAYDLERILEGSYPSECTWVDVYFNGFYNGMYLLINSVKGRSAFQFEEDGFLLEKEMPTRLRNEYFITEHGGESL